MRVNTIIGDIVADQRIDVTRFQMECHPLYRDISDDPLFAANPMDSLHNKQGCDPVGVADYNHLEYKGQDDEILLCEIGRCLTTLDKVQEQK